MGNRKLDPLIMAAFEPFAAFFEKAGIKPNHLTLLGGGLSLIGAAYIAAGELRTGICIVIFTWLFDVIDGALAKHSGHITRFGGFLDSVMDRYTEGLVFAAFAYYYADRGDPVMVGITMISTIGALTVPYARARAEKEIPSCSVGVGARLTRLVILAFFTLVGVPGAGIILVLLLSHYTVLQRIVYTRQVLNGEGKKDL